VIAALELDQLAEGVVELLLPGRVVAAGLRPLGAHAGQKRSHTFAQILQGFLARGAQPPVAGADGFALGFRQPPPFAAGFKQIVLGL
jgi:hypothetical protein